MNDKIWYNALKQLEDRGLLKRDKPIDWMDMFEFGSYRLSDKSLIEFCEECEEQI